MTLLLLLQDHVVSAVRWVRCMSCALILHVHAGAELQLRNCSLHLRFWSINMVYMNAFELLFNHILNTNAF